MSRLTGNDAKGLMEAYQAVYTPVLNEELVDENEVQELAEQIIENAAYVLFSQGYDVDDVISYFTEATEETIIEDFVTLTEGNLIIESIAVSDVYIEEQFQQLDEVIAGALRLAGRGASAAGRVLSGAGGKVTSAGRKATAISKAQTIKKSRDVKMAKWKQGSLATPIVPKKPGLLQKATNFAQGAMTRAKDVVKKVPGAKTAGAIARSPVGKFAGGTLKRVIPGLGVAGGVAGAVDSFKKGDPLGVALNTGSAIASAIPGGGLVSAGLYGAQAARELTGNAKGSTPTAKTAPAATKAKYNASAALGGQTAFKAGGGAAAMKKNSNLSAADIQKRGTQALYSAGGGKAAEVQKGQTRAQVVSQGSKNVSPRPSAPAAPAAPSGGGGGGGGAPEVAATNRIASAPSQPAVKPAATPSAQPAGFERRAATSAELRDAQKARASTLASGGSKENAEKAAVQAGVDRGTKLMGGPEGPGKIDPSQIRSSTNPEQEKRKRDAAAAAKAPTRAPILQTQSYEYDAFDIVLEYLIDEGHAEDVMEAAYLMTEMSGETICNIVEARGSYSAKKARAGKDIGKPGKQFAKIAKSAGKRYGSKERGEKVAGAVLANLRKKKRKTQKEY